MIDPKASLAQKGNEIFSNLEELVTPQQFKTWFKSMDLQSDAENTYIFTVPNDFLREWISKYYFNVLHKAIERTRRDDSDFKLLVHTSETEPEMKEGEEGKGEEGKSSVKVRSIADVDENPPVSAAQTRPATAPQSQPPPERDMDFFLNPNYGFENFVVGPSNQLSYAACLAVADNPSKAYNPLFIHGSSGLGKTHLLQAICHKLYQNNHRAKIRFLSCETFINHFISSLERGKIDEFRHRYRHIDVLLIDDVHLLASKERTQEEFFHTFNSLYNSGKQIVLSSDSSPSEIPTLEERLVSRFKWGLLSEIYPPDFETRCAILRMKSRLKGVTVPDDVIAYLAENIATNIRELEGAIIKVVGYSTLMNRTLDLEMACEAMKDVIKKTEALITFDHVVKVITEHFSIKLSDLQSKRRNRAIAQPRQIAMYIIKKLTNHSLQEIGAYFGGRDHTTVLHAHTQMDKKIRSDESFKARVNDLILKIQNNA